MCAVGVAVEVRTGTAVFVGGGVGDVTWGVDEGKTAGDCEDCCLPQAGRMIEIMIASGINFFTFINNSFR